VAGALGGESPPSPPPRSWAAREDSDVAIWCIRMEARARWTLPAARAQSARTLYFFGGSSLRVAEEPRKEHAALSLRADVEVTLEAGDEPCELLLLQGRPIGKPVVQYGPFVMNTRNEIEKAFLDYRRTGFGGWPWPADDPVHSRDAGRFAKHADGRVERP